MTLMPVTRICASVDCSTNSGALRWIGRVLVWPTGPRSSTGSPITFRMRPSVSGPTGMAIGWPVSTAFSPRTRPSVVSMAMVRTSDSPRCCATSSTIRRLSALTCSAFRMCGRSASKRTSTTAPVIWVIVPMLLVAMKVPFSLNLDGFGAGDDLDEFLGDRRLPRAVHLQRQLLDHVARVARGAVHRRHLRAVEARRILEQDAEDLDGEVARQQVGQDLALVRLELVDRAARHRRSGRAGFRRRRRNELLHRHRLAHRRAEAIEDHGGDVEFAGLEQLGDARRYLARVGERQARPAELGDGVDDQRSEVAAELVTALAADAQDLDRLALGQQRADQTARLANDGAVEGAAQAAIRGGDDHELDPVRAGARQQPGTGAPEALPQRGQDLVHRLGIGTGGHRLLL